jgi:NDP-sugar pyrophosphorylase family protein
LGLDSALPGDTIEGANTPLDKEDLRSAARELGRGTPEEAKGPEEPGESGSKSCRLSQEIKSELGRLGFSDDVIDEISRRSMRFEEGRIIARKSFLHLLAEIEGIKLGDVVRRMLFHERVHNLIDAHGSKDRIIAAINGILRAEFIERFDEEFGPFDSEEDRAEEILVQYYSEKFENRRSDLFDTISDAIDGVMQDDFGDLHELCRIADFAENASADEVKAVQIKKLKEVIAKAKEAGAERAIKFEKGSPEAEWASIAALASAKTRPSGFVSRPVPATLSMRLDEVRSQLGPDSQKRLRQLEALRDLNKRNIEGLEGVGREGVNEDNTFIGKNVVIEEGAIIRPGAIITGKSYISAGAVIEGTVHDSFIGREAKVIQGSEVVNSLLEEGASVEGSCLRNAKVGQRSRLVDVTVETKDYDLLAPGEWGYDAHHMVREHQTVIGSDCQISNQAYIKNSIIGDRTKIDGGSFDGCEIGEDNDLHRLKAVLIHTEFDVIVDPVYPDGRPAPAEIQERWIGFGYRHYGAEIYATGYAGNVVATPRGAYHVYQGSPEGDHVVYSDFDGTGVTVGREYVGRARDKVIASSAHRHFLLRPLAWVGGQLDHERGRSGSWVNIVGQPANPPVTDFETPNVTDILPATVVGPGNRIIVWGKMLGRRGAQSWADEDPTYTLVNAPNFFAGGIMVALDYERNNRERIIASLEKRRAALKKEGFSDEELEYLQYKELGDIIPAILEARIKTIEGLLASGVASGVRGTVVPKLQQALAVYRLHLESELGRELWAIENGELKHWKYNAETNDWEPKNPSEFQRFIDAGLVADPQDSPWPRSSEFYKGYEAPKDEDRYGTTSFAPLTAMNLEEVEVGDERIGVIPEKFLVLKNVEIHPSAQIDDSVVIEEGTPDRPTIIGPGTVLQENSVVKAGAKLYRTRGLNAVFGRNGEFNFVRASSASDSKLEFKDDCTYSYCKAIATNNKNLTFGKGSKGDHAYVKAGLIHTKIGEGTTLFSFARVANSRIGPRSKIGCRVSNSKLGTGFTAQHAATRISNVDAPDTKYPNASNVAAGAIVGSKDRTKKRVRLNPGSFVGTNAIVESGCEVGELCYVVGRLRAGTSLLPLTFYKEGRATLLGTLDNQRLHLAFAGRFGVGYPLRYATNDSQRKEVNFRLESILIDLADKIFKIVKPSIDPNNAEAQTAMHGLERFLKEAREFIKADIAGQRDDLTRQQRIVHREELFKTVTGFIESLRKAGVRGDVSTLLSRLAVACENLRDGRFRMRDGTLTDATWHNLSEEPNRPNFEVIQYTEENISAARNTAQLLRRKTIADSDKNVAKFRVKLEALATRKRTEPIGLIVSAITIMENIGGPDLLTDLFMKRMADEGNAFRVVVFAETDRQQNVIEALQIPGIEGVRVQPEQSKAEKMQTLIGRLNALGVKNENIGMIENPTDEPERLIKQLQATAPDIYIGVPRIPGPGQLLSLHGIFTDVIRAVAGQEAKKVFAIELPAIEQPTKELLESFEEYREAIEFLRNA